MRSHKLLTETIQNTVDIIEQEKVPVVALNHKKEYKQNMKMIKILASEFAINFSKKLSENEKRLYSETVINTIKETDVFIEPSLKLDKYKKIIQNNAKSEKLPLNIATAFSNALLGYADPTIVYYVSNSFTSTIKLMNNTINKIKINTSDKKID